jgi:hypothetical protein
MAAINPTAGQYACSDRDDRSIEKDDKRHIGGGNVAHDYKGLMLYLMISLDVDPISFVF